jgi:hypothetical protein
VDDELAVRIHRARRRYLTLWALSAVAGACLGLTWWSYRGLDPLTGAFAGLLVGIVLASVVLARVGRRDMDRHAIVMLASQDAEPRTSANLAPQALESVRQAVDEAEHLFEQRQPWEKPLDDAASAVGRAVIEKLEGRSRLARNVRLRVLLLAGLVAVAVLAPGAPSGAPSGSCPGPELDVMFAYRGTFQFAYDGQTWVDLTDFTRTSSPCVVDALAHATPLAGAGSNPAAEPLLPNVLSWEPVTPPVVDGLGPVRSVIVPFGQWAESGPIAGVAGPASGEYSWYRLSDDDALVLVRQLFEPVD